MADNFSDLPSKQQIRDRIRVVVLSLTGTPMKVFASDVDYAQRRYIFYISVKGDGVSSRLVNLAYGGSGTGARSTAIESNLPVAPAAYVPLPAATFFLEDPFITLVGGENLLFSQTVGTGVSVSVYYYDSQVYSVNQT